MIKGLLINVQTNVIFFKSYDSEFSPSPQLLGGFLSAISLFAKDLSHDEVRAIIMGKSKFYYNKLDEDTDLNMIVFSDPGVEDKNLRGLILELRKSFNTMYNLEDIKSHINEPTYFNPFEDSVDNIVLKARQKGQFGQGIRQLDIYDIADIKPEKLKRISFSFLLDNLKKGLGRVFFSIFTGIRVIVAGDPSVVRIVIDSLELFSPHKVLNKVYYTENLDETGADIVGVPSYLADIFIDSTVINLKNFKITETVKNSSYFDKVVKKIIKIKDENKILTVISKNIKILIEKTKELIYLINKEDRISNGDIKRFMKNIDTDILRILKSYLKNNNIRYSEVINEVCEKVRIQLLAKDFCL
jgi:hypothetical protein